MTLEFNSRGADTAYGDVDGYCNGLSVEGGAVNRLPYGRWPSFFMVPTPGVKAPIASYSWRQRL
jgi:hypothetical protein